VRLVASSLRHTKDALARRMWQEEEMGGMPFGAFDGSAFFSGVPLWLIALLLAAVAPTCVRLFASSLERRVQRRTVECIEQLVPRVTPEQECNDGTSAALPRRGSNKETKG
jgi:hypothetical protein